MLNCSALYYLVEVSHSRSLSLAAENLYLSRQALSQSIKGLEEELGILLLERSHEGISLTEDGTRVVEIAEKILMHISEIEQLAAGTKPQPIELTIHLPQSLAANYGAALAIAYSRQFPDSGMQILSIDGSSPCQLVQEHPDRFAFGIFNENYSFPESIHAITIDKSKAYVITGQDSPFIPKGKKSISLREVQQLPLILTRVSEEQSYQAELLNSIRKYGEPNIKFTISHMGAALPLVQQNLGVCPHVHFRHVESHDPDQYRIISINNMPRVIVALLYHEDMPQEKVDCLLTLLNQI